MTPNTTRPSAHPRGSRPASLLLCCLLGTTLLPGYECGEPINDDPGFDIWCGKQLCSWSVDKGGVQRVPTWHRSDWGVELQGSDVSLSQVSGVSSADVSCFELQLQADRDDGVELYFELDFLNDGVVDHSHPLTSDGFEPVRYKLKPPSWYEGVRFIIRKKGSGRAVLAEIKITQASDCQGDAVTLSSRPVGVKCESNSQCLGGRCQAVQQWKADLKDATVSVCSACASDADCTGSQVCGLTWGAKYYLHRACVTPGTRLLGERCLDTRECASGSCCGGVCSQCCDGAGCATGQQCQTLDYRTLGTDYEAQLLPSLCDAGKGQGAKDASCLSGKDCQSAVCQASGTLGTCFLDGRTCSVAKDCPLWEVCLVLGSKGGKCL